MKYPPSEDVRALVRQAYAIDSPACTAIAVWMKKLGVSPSLHASLGTSMALPTDAILPPGVTHKGKPWVSLGLRLIAPLCDTEGMLRNVVAQGIGDCYQGAAVLNGANCEGLVVACPSTRRMLMGRGTLSKLVVVDNCCSWLKMIDRNHRDHGVVGAIGLLPGSWTVPLGQKIPSGCQVIFAPNVTVSTDRLRAAYHCFEPYAEKSKIDLRCQPFKQDLTS